MKGNTGIHQKADPSPWKLPLLVILEGNMVGKSTHLTHLGFRNQIFVLVHLGCHNRPKRNLGKDRLISNYFPFPQSPTYHRQSLIYFQFLQLYHGYFIQMRSYNTWPDWLLSHSIMFSSFIYIIACISTLFLFVAK